MTAAPLRVPPPTVETDEDLNTALGTLALLNSREAAGAAELKQRTAAIAAEIQARQVVAIGRSRQTFAEYRAALVEAATQYAESHRSELLDGQKGKSRRFTAGTVCWRKGKAKLVDIDGQKSTTEAKLLVASEKFGVGGLLTRILKSLAGLRINKAVAASDLFKVSLTPDRVRLLALAQSQDLSAVWLEERNLRVDEGGESVVLEPDESFVRSERREAA